MAVYKITGENAAVFHNEHFSREPRFTTWKSRERYENTGILPEMPYRFRVCDDDEITYFWGICSSDSTFGPLDYEGTDYGCTYIEYKNPKTGEYEPL